MTDTELFMMISKGVPQNKADKDYVRDGLLYCYKCHTPKQYRMTQPIGGGEIFTTILPVACKCAKEAAEQEKKQREIVVRKNDCFYGFSRYENITFADDKLCTGIVDGLKAYADSFDKQLRNGTGILLSGAVGTGKTFYAACIANSIIHSGYSVKMINLSEVINSDWDNRAQYIAGFDDYDLLIIDDVGVERNTPTANEIVYTVINNRYCSGNPMIVTTNVRFSDMKKCSDIEKQRIYDRIIERCYPINLGEESYRKTIAKDLYMNNKDIFGG